MGMNLTEQAKQICRDNYTTNCGGCPMRTACVARTGPGREGLEKWTAGVNEAAESAGGQLTLF